MEEIADDDRMAAALSYMEEMFQPYRHIGVASTFSPRFLAVLAEADRIARRLSAPLSVIHADAPDAEREKRFEEAFETLKRDAKTPVLWSHGETPLDAIVAACHGHKVDLLLAGALERETEHRYFVGGVARGLLQRAVCDLFLFTEPEETETEIENIVIEVDVGTPAIPMLTRACELASVLGARQVTFIGIVTPFDEAAASAEGRELPASDDEFAALIDAVSGFEGTEDCRLLRSNTGFSMCDFVQDCGADLLMVGWQSKEGRRTLPRHMDWLLQVIPTNVLLIGEAAGSGD